MPVATFDQFQLGPRFFRLELERAIAMRRLALQQFPLELSAVSKDVVRAVEEVVQATVEYGEQLAVEVHRVSTNMQAVDAMGPAARIEQVLEALEALERRVQGLIRYGWLIEREWMEYVQAPASTSDAAQHGAGGVFPAGYLRGLDAWHMVLAKAMARVRVRAAEARYGQAGGE
ncbi:hypothetical protein IWW52_006708, partial [Coemansia sp. RSA 2704]